MIYNGNHEIMPQPEDSMFSANHKIIIPVLLSLFILLGLTATVLIIKKKSEIYQNAFNSSTVLFVMLSNISESSQNRILASSQSETPSIANIIMSKNNAEPNYPSVRVPNSNLSFSSVDSNKYKVEGNGENKRLSFPRTFNEISNLLPEYIEDLCPYATFQLNKQTYSESSYSGNVYSGPYHSVRGSFVYHENKSDNYRVRYFSPFFDSLVTDSFFHSDERARIHKSSKSWVPPSRRRSRRTVSW